MFEIHVTVESNNVDNFIADCKEFGCKPILIELESYNKFSYNQLMTSQSFKRKNYFNEIDRIKKFLVNKGYSISRIKVEVHPNFYNQDIFKYLETHFRVKLNIKNVEQFGKLCIENNFHKSKNVFKKIDNDTFYLMATYRTNVIDLIRFDKIISNFKNVLNNNSFEFDKVEVEACIIDTNESLDYKWLL